MNPLTLIAAGFATVAVTFTFAGQAQAEADRLQNDFTFKRVQVPSSSANRLITVQVTPGAPRGPQAPSAAGSAVASPAAARPAVSKPRTSGYEWFWAGVSPALADGGPGRLQLALATLRQPPAGKSAAVPRLQTLQQISNDHGLHILRATVGTDVSPALVLALIAIESGGKTEVESHAGAVGLMQLMPATAARFGVTDRTDPADNIKGGVAYLAWLLDHFDNDPVLVLAGYNAGEGAVRDNGGVPPYAETRAYVPKVLSAWTVARGLCMTPPELVTDGCVFHNNGA